MTRPRGDTRDQVAAATRRLESEGMHRPPLVGPGTVRSAVPPGRTKWTVRMMVDGRRRTRAEAAETFAHQAFAATAEEAGMSAGFYCWLIDEALDPRRTR